jgi:hypothetical protein
MPLPHESHHLPAAVICALNASSYVLSSCAAVQRAIALLHIDIMQYTAIYPHLCSTPWYIDTSSATLSTTGLMARTSVSSAG